jgi:glutathione S-transferase
MKAKAQRGAEAAIADPLDVYRAFFLDGKRFIGGEAPSIADSAWPRRSSSCARSTSSSPPGPRST